MGRRHTIVIGSRSSSLSMVQAKEVQWLLSDSFSDYKFNIIPLSTQGDRNKTAPLISMDRGMFVKEIEEALLSEKIDIAVHSAKDLPATVMDGLTIGAFSERIEPRDVLVNRWGLSLMEIPSGARIGTGSLRRIAQIKAVRSDIEMIPIRGNVGTRIEKIHSDEYDGVVLAGAGLIRLNLQDEISDYLSLSTCVPEVGQGALAIEARSSDFQTIEMLSKINHRLTSCVVSAERAFLRVVDGGCGVPMSAYAQMEGDSLHILAMVAEPDGSHVFRVQVTCDAGDSALAAHSTVKALIDKGAGEIMGIGSN